MTMTTLRQQMRVLLVTCKQCPKHRTFCSNHNGEQDKLRQEQDKLVTHESSSITITGYAARWKEPGVQVVGHIVLHSVLTALHQTLAQPIRVWLGNVREEDTVTVGATEHHVR